MPMREEINYEKWPEDSFFDPKRKLHEIVQNKARNGEKLTDAELSWLLDKTKHFYILLEHSAEMRLKLLAEVMITNLEKAALQAELDKKK